MANISLVSLVALASVISLTLGRNTIVTQPGPCFGCVLKNGIGYVTPPNEDCDTFFQCQYNQGGEVIATLLRCGFGTFWDQYLLTCNHINRVRCNDTRCLGKQDGHRFKVNGNCSEYYECEDQVRELRVCPDGSSFNTTTLDCVEDANCTTIPPTDTCPLLGSEDDMCVFGQLVHGEQVIQNCPAGLGFNKTTCGCTIRLTTCGPVSVACEPLVDIDFETDEPGEYDNYGALIDTAAGTAYFDGTAAIRIPRLSNVEFRKNLTIKVSYKVDYNSTFVSMAEEAVVTNGDCGKYSTIEITRAGNDTILRAANFHATSEDTTELVIATEEDWRYVKFFFNIAQGTLFGDVNDRTDEVYFPGPIIRSQCAFQLGGGHGLDNFRGWISDIIVTECDHQTFV